MNKYDSDDDSGDYDNRWWMGWRRMRRRLRMMMSAAVGHPIDDPRMIMTGWLDSDLIIISFVQFPFSGKKRKRS